MILAPSPHRVGGFFLPNRIYKGLYLKIHLTSRTQFRPIQVVFVGLG